MSIEQIQQIIDSGGECKTRDGREARVFMVADTDQGFPVLGVIKDCDGFWSQEAWTLNGCASVPRKSSHADLILPRVVAYERWVNQYPWNAIDHWSLDDAEKNRVLGCLATHKYTYYTDASKPDVETVWRRGDEWYARY
jgi:hypothetical protein